MTGSQDATVYGDPDKPSVARMYDYLLGGTHNLQIDRDAIEQTRLRLPEFSDIAWANRGFLQRAARWLAEQGITQFIDVGAGLPTANNTHDAVQKVNPAAKVVYVDNNPDVVLAAQQLTAGLDSVRAIPGELEHPAGILEHPEVRGLIDFGQPVAVLMVAILHFVPPETDPWTLVGQYIDALAPGSYVAISHATFDKQPEKTVAAAKALYGRSSTPLRARTRAEVAKFFDGLELIPPYAGAAPQLTFAGEWGAEDPALADSDGSRWTYVGVGRKP
jgi:hypothetical protein